MLARWRRSRRRTSSASALSDRAKAGHDRRPCPTPHHHRLHRRHPASPRGASPPTSSAACCARSAPLDEQLEQSDLGALPERDRALVRTIVATVLRRLGTLRHLLAAMLEKGLPPIGAEGRRHPADRRRANPVPRCAGPRRRSICRCGWRRPTPRLALFRPRQRACCASSRGTARPASPALDTALLDTPEWLMQRWIAQYGDAAARAIATAHTQEPALDLTVKQRSARLGRDAQRPRARHRHGADHRLGADPAVARLRRRRVVGAGRRCGLAGAVVGRRARQVRRRSLRRAGRQDRAARAGRRGGDRGRSLGAAPGAGAAEPGAASAQRRDRQGRRRGVCTAGRSTRCWWTHPARRPAQSAAIPTSPG